MTDTSPLRLWATVTALAGLASLATVLTFQNLPEVKAATGCAKESAVLYYEFARSQADLDALFGLAGSDCRPKVIAAMDAVNTVDVWLFIPAYTLFVSAAALFLSGGALRPLAWVAIALAIVAAGTDYVETLNLLAYTPDLAPGPRTARRKQLGRLDEILLLRLERVGARRTLLHRNASQTLDPGGAALPADRRCDVDGDRLAPDASPVACVLLELDGAPGDGRKDHCDWPRLAHRKWHTWHKG